MRRGGRGETEDEGRCNENHEQRSRRAVHTILLNLVSNTQLSEIPGSSGSQGALTRFLWFKAACIVLMNRRDLGEFLPRIETDQRLAELVYNGGHVWGVAMNGDLRVGTWLVQPGLNTISQNGTSRQLEPKVMEVLVCLAHHPGETLPKEQLLKTVWPDTFVSDDVLVRSISEIRRAFEDDPRESKFIQTIPKRGYRPCDRGLEISRHGDAINLFETGSANRHRDWGYIHGCSPGAISTDAGE